VQQLILVKMEPEPGGRTLEHLACRPDAHRISGSGAVAAAAGPANPFLPIPLVEPVDGEVGGDLTDRRVQITEQAQQQRARADLTNGAEPAAKIEQARDKAVHIQAGRELRPLMEERLGEGAHLVRMERWQRERFEPARERGSSLLNRLQVALVFLLPAGRHHHRPDVEEISEQGRERRQVGVVEEQVQGVEEYDRLIFRRCAPTSVTREGSGLPVTDLASSLSSSSTSTRRGSPTVTLPMLTSVAAWSSRPATSSNSWPISTLLPAPPVARTSWTSAWSAASACWRRLRKRVSTTRRRWGGRIMGSSEERVRSRRRGTLRALRCRVEPVCS
jgi:hypothetical protein